MSLFIENSSGAAKSADVGIRWKHQAEARTRRSIAILVCEVSDPEKQLGLHHFSK